MNQEIFTVAGKSFLSIEMGIDLNHLEQKIISDTPKSTDFFRRLIDFILTLRSKGQYLELGPINNTKNKSLLNKQLCSFFSESNFTDKSMEYFIFDTIRHAFINYCQGDILQVYKQREAECWYPKIIIKQNIGSRNDIELLNNEVVIIYRGTSKNEYNSKSFGQSWTLNKKIAQQFAFEHYRGQNYYSEMIRVILKAKINKQNIFYYDEKDKEEEIIVNSDKIIPYSINILKENILN